MLSNPLTCFLFCLLLFLIRQVEWREAWVTNPPCDRYPFPGCYLFSHFFFFTAPLNFFLKKSLLTFLAWACQASDCCWLLTNGTLAYPPLTSQCAMTTGPQATRFYFLSSSGFYYLYIYIWKYHQGTADATLRKQPNQEQGSFFPERKEWVVPERHVSKEGITNQKEM